MGERVKTRRKKGLCYQCGSTLHMAKECPESVCQFCGESGHTPGSCPRKEELVDLGSFGASRGKFRYIELFAGIGGFRLALDHLGGRCVFASEIDRFARKNYEMNHKDRPAGDITKISADLVPDHELLVGGFPCQTFSSSGTQMGFEDDRGLLFLEVVRLLKQKQPKAFLLENVRGLVTHKGCATLQTILSELHDSGYAVQYEVLDAVNLVPQERKRVYLVGIRNGLDNQSYRFPNFETLSHRGFVDIEQRDLSLEAIETLCLTEHQLEKVKSQKYTIRFPESRFLSNKSKATKTLQSSYASYMVGSQFVPAPKEAISRWRRLSPREAARLQGFPENFQLCSARPYHLLGNAVVPSMIVLVAAPLLPLLYATEEEASNWETKGWQVAARLLLDASPADERKAKFQSSIEQIAKAAIYRVQ